MQPSQLLQAMLIELGWPSDADCKLAATMQVLRVRGISAGPHKLALRRRHVLRAVPAAEPAVGSGLWRQLVMLESNPRLVPDSHQAGCTGPPGLSAAVVNHSTISLLQCTGVPLTQPAMACRD